jgi:hypothetical protein
MRDPERPRGILLIGEPGRVATAFSAAVADHDEIGVLALPEARVRDVVAIKAACV